MKRLATCENLLRLAPPAGPKRKKTVRAALTGLPPMDGRSILLRFLPALSAHRGRLLSGEEGGTPVHAGTFLRKREIVLETELLDRPAELRRILAHELFHFAWRRLGNGARRAFESMLDAEIERRDPGELGWSAEWRKLALTPRDRRRRTRRWREYLCESFCDTAAWVYGDKRRRAEVTLAVEFREIRRDWFREGGEARTFSI